MNKRRDTCYCTEIEEKMTYLFIHSVTGVIVMDERQSHRYAVIPTPTLYCRVAARLVYATSDTSPSQTAEVCL